MNKQEQKKLKELHEEIQNFYGFAFLFVMSFLFSFFWLMPFLICILFFKIGHLDDVLRNIIKKTNEKTTN